MPEINPKNKEQFRLSLMKNQLVYERRYKAALKPVLIAQEREALVNLEAKASSFKKEFDEKLFDDAKADKEFANVLNPVVVDLSMEQGALALVFAGDEDSEFTMTDFLRALLTRSTSRMAERFNDATLAALNKTLAEGIAAGESLGKLKKRVQEVYQKVRGYRSARIARTETLKASNNATNEAYKQTGYVKAKKWYANPGHCPICASLDGTTINLTEPFATVGQSVPVEDGDPYQVTYDDVVNPPAHPNCRCTIVPVR